MQFDELLRETKKWHRGSITPATHRRITCVRGFAGSSDAKGVFAIGIVTIEAKHMNLPHAEEHGRSHSAEHHASAAIDNADILVEFMNGLYIHFGIVLRCAEDIHLHLLEPVKDGRL